MAESDDALTIRHVAERLMKAHPELDADLVESSVRTAYEELRYARVRTYLPILMEQGQGPAALRRADGSPDLTLPAPPAGRCRPRRRLTAGEDSRSGWGRQGACGVCCSGTGRSGLLVARAPKSWRTQVRDPLIDGSSRPVSHQCGTVTRRIACGSLAGMAGTRGSRPRRGTL
ncbi:three-helix bundle dimerization domain-containing protein [Streptomyces sp. NPDC048357]|uniref:three-helix bundle dimerization domain-containing protein n=1 Tax=Streptomyces sp. NPDC048357 TaxID=3154719 RepID=UPI003428BF33